MTHLKSLLICASAAAIILSGCSSDDKDTNGGEPVAVPRSARIVSVDYHPAPGQFVNTLPVYTPGETAASMNSKAMANLNSGNLVTLGSFGGYIIMKTQDPVINHKDKADLLIKGNAIANAAEPGVVEVSVDGSTWYALKGEKWDESVPDFEVTYSQPAADATDARYIQWTSPTGASGWINRVADYHTQPFFPQWLAASSPMTFTSRRLPDNGRLDTNRGIYILSPYKGYADSYPNNSDDAWLDIDNAVDANGDPVHLASVSYIKVTTGVLQTNGNLGECSTEISGILIQP